MFTSGGFTGVAEAVSRIDAAILKVSSDYMYSVGKRTIEVAGTDARSAIIIFGLPDPRPRT
jgi:hypothetical protein